MDITVFFLIWISIAVAVGHQTSAVNMISNEIRYSAHELKSLRPRKSQTRPFNLPKEIRLRQRGHDRG